MSESRKYYYLKLKDDFFDREEIVVIEAMPQGDVYVNIMMKMYLRSLKHGGKLMFREGIPYNLGSLATVLRKSEAEVKFAIDLFVKFGLVEVLESGAIFMLDIQNFIGKSTTEADRKRDYRNRIDDEKPALGHLSDKNPPEIELEIELEIENKNILPEKSGDCDLSEKEIRFEKFWELYERKGNKVSAKKAFMKLSEAKLKQIALKINDYLKSTPDKQFRLDAEKYLNPVKEHWNDEIRKNVSKPSRIISSTEQLRREGQFDGGKVSKLKIIDESHLFNE